VGTVALVPRGKAAGAWSWPLTCNKCRGPENVDLHTCLHGVVLNYISTGTTFRVCFIPTSSENLHSLHLWWASSCQKTNASIICSIFLYLSARKIDFVDCTVWELSVETVERITRGSVSRRDARCNATLRVASVFDFPTWWETYQTFKQACRRAGPYIYPPGTTPIEGEGVWQYLELGEKISSVSRLQSFL
jgi:hypothetical protein